MSLALIAVPLKGLLPRSAVALPVLLALLLGACASRPVAVVRPPSYWVLEGEARGGDFTHLTALRNAWLQLPDAGARLARVAELENQALQMFDQPLRLGAIGNAILEQFPGSLLGHMAMASFFDRVAQPTDAAREHASAKAISDELLRSGDGTAARPYAAIATSDATALMRQQGFIGLGSIYTDTTEGKLHLNLLVSQGPAKPLRTLVFDVTPTFSRLLEIQPLKDKKPASVPQLLFDLARRGDSGAMTTAATQLMREDVAQQTAAFRLLQQAVTDGNLYARLSLAQAYLNAYAGETDTDQKQELLHHAVEQLEQSVAAGSDVAMLELGRVYLSGLAGAAKKPDGIALIEKSVSLQQPAAMLLLARLSNAGEGVPKDAARARALLLQAAQLGSIDAKLAYAQVLLSAQPSTLDDPARNWLTELSRDEQPKAMLLFAGVQARGVHVTKDIRAAKKLYRAVAGNVRKDPELINDVVWTLAVTDVPQLRDPREALKLMDQLMTVNKDAAANPAFLDTWAAANAANGKFPRAVELQEQALEAAKTQSPADVVKVLGEHLAAFKRGEAITEKVP